MRRALILYLELEQIDLVGSASKRCGESLPVQSSTDRLKPERSLAPGPSVASAEIQGVSAAPSQTFSAMPCRIGGSGPWHYGYPREDDSGGLKHEMTKLVMSAIIKL
jgi:hypothetical protein